MKAGRLIALVVASASSLQAAEPAHIPYDAKQQAFFKDYCVACHNAAKHEGQLRLDNISFAIDSPKQADRWQKILNQLNAGEMPPEDAKPPEPNRKADFLDALSHALVSARKRLGDQHGRITMRRLNRREYRNTIRALLGVEVDVRNLPADSGTGSFDTVGTSLFMSGDQIEQYLTIGRRAIDEYYARASIGAQRFVAHEEAEVVGNQRMDGLFNRTREQHANHARWAAAVDKAAARPENLKIAAELREKAKKPRPSSGVPWATPLFFYYDWALIKGAPPPTGFGFKDAQDAFFEENNYELFFPYFEDYQKLPARDTGAWLLFYQGYREAYISAGKDWPPGRYTLRLRAAGNDAARPGRRFIEFGRRGNDISEFTVLGSRQVTGTLARPSVIEMTVEVSARGKREFAIREKRPNSYTAEIRSYHDVFEQTGHGPPPAVWLDWLEIEGPLPAPRAAVALTAKTEDVAGAREVIERFAHHAFRGVAPGTDYLDKLVGVFEAWHRQSGSYDQALKEALSVVLASPSFLYLHEPGDDTTRRRLNGLELATRLSYFLWSGPPDDTLLTLALENRLGQPDVLATQVDRMMADRRSRQFVDGFTHQWLGMDRLDFFQFDYRLHRSFDDSTKSAAREEVYQTVSYLLRDNVSLRLLLKSDTVVINSLLADYYGLDGIRGEEFRNVSLPPDSPRGGLLGMAAILAMGSNGQTTSPVERGAWVLRKLLHDPPPPAPANVPQLARLDGQLLDVRARLRVHQEQPQCANCHRRIDPIGFGLENFNAAGIWRTEDTIDRPGVGKKTWPVNPSGEFFKGPAFHDYFELRDIIASRCDDFARGFTEALIEYALGRPYGFSDHELAATIVRRAKGRDYAMREFIHALVASEAFQMK